MLRIEKFEVPTPEQWEIVIEGMRNPKNSWDRMDSGWQIEQPDSEEAAHDYKATWVLGKNDHELMTTLANGGPVHAKYRRMLPVWVTITAPLFWWKEFDTYKVGTVCNSCSTMHKIHAKEFVMDDFSTDGLIDFSWNRLDDMITHLNIHREKFLETKNIEHWDQMIMLLPSCYNQKRTIMLNYEVLSEIYKWRKNHKLPEWHTLCDWIETLPYSELITGES